jgi:TRAP-type mannitol/chloroaromatic compound transport system substrate-binding protein
LRDVIKTETLEEVRMKVKRKELRKIGIAVSLVVALAIVVPMMSGCLPGKPAAAPPGEIAPPAVPAETAAEAPTYHFRITSPFGAPDTEEDMRVNYAQVMEDLSGGRITATVYEPGELMPEGEVVAAVRQGTIDICWWYATTGFETPFTDLEAGFPFETSCPSEFQSLFTHRGFDRLVKESYDDIGVHYIGNAMTDPFNVISTVPIRTYEDFNGIKMNVTGPLAPAFAPAGVSTVVFPVEEFYLTGQTGVVDALFWAGATEYTGMKLYEVYPYIMMPAFVDPCNSSILMNQELWDSLPSDIQAIVYYATEHMGKHCFIKRFNGESRDIANWEHITTLPDEDVQKLFENQLLELKEIAKRSPRTAEGVKVLLEYKIELLDRKWLHSAYTLDPQPIYDLLEELRAEGLIFD